MNKIVKYPELKPEFQEAGHDLPKLDAIIRRVAGARHELKEQGREIIEYTQRFEGMNGEGFRLLGQWARIDEELHRAWKAVNRSTEMVRSVLYPGESESEADEKDIALLRRDTVKAIRERYAEIAAIARLNRIPDQCLAQAMELDWSVEQFCQETERFMKP